MIEKIKNKNWYKFARIGNPFFNLMFDSSFTIIYELTAFSIFTAGCTIFWIVSKLIYKIVSKNLKLTGEVGTQFSKADESICSLNNADGGCNNPNDNNKCTIPDCKNKGIKTPKCDNTKCNKSFFKKIWNWSKKHPVIATTCSVVVVTAVIICSWKIGVIVCKIYFDSGAHNNNDSGGHDNNLGGLLNDWDDDNFMVAVDPELVGMEKKEHKIDNF